MGSRCGIDGLVGHLNDSGSFNGRQSAKCPVGKSSVSRSSGWLAISMVACGIAELTAVSAPAATLDLSTTGYGTGTVDFGTVRYSQESLSNGATSQQVSLINGTPFGTAYFSTYDNVYNTQNRQLPYSPVPTFISGIHSTPLDSSGGATAAVALNYLSSFDSYPLTGLGTPQPGIKVLSSGYDYFVAGKTSAGLTSGQDQFVPITATLVTPVPALSTDATLVGQTVPFGQTASFSLTIANNAVVAPAAPTNAQALTVSAVNLNSANTQFSVSSSQNFVVQPQATKTVTLTFTPDRSFGGGAQGTSIYLTDDYGHDFGTTGSDGYNGISFTAYAPSIVAAGSGSAAQALGGAAVTGGVGATLSSATGGDFGADFTEPTSAQLPGSVNFQLPGSTDQEWDLTYSGTLASPATIVLHFDPSLIDPSVILDSLTIEHYTNGAWVNLPSVVDTTADTITFQTGSFSPFALGVSPVPEPASIGLIAICPILLMRRREKLGR